MFSFDPVDAGGHRRVEQTEGFGSNPPDTILPSHDAELDRAHLWAGALLSPARG
jgi:hypothetical protein